MVECCRIACFMKVMFDDQVAARQMSRIGTPFRKAIKVAIAWVECTLGCDGRDLLHRL